MSTLIAVMDRAGFDANTDNLVLVVPEDERLLWIPRDLWCHELGNRINSAYRLGGEARLRSALREHNLEPTHVLVLSRSATEAACAEVAVIVPVPARMEFDYPLTPTSRIEDGRRRIAFDPPAVMLRKERVHQWIGARGGSDLHRIERQKVLVRRLLDTRFSFARALADPTAYRWSSDAAVDELARVSSAWRFETMGPLEPIVINAMQVLVPQTRVQPKVGS